MTDSPLAAVVRRLRHQLGQPFVDNLSDAVLLERFVRQRDQDAFAALVRRHGPLVWRVCRRILRQTQQAEEAYQATFLALVQQAAKIRKPEALVSWLYGVAYRIARKARASLPREQCGDREPIAATNADPAGEVAWRELERIVVEEVQALPEKYRLPILLCYWEGLTNAEAAVRLSWPEGTVKTRFLKARQLLHDRLTRRGVSLSAGAFVTLLAAGSGDAAVPPTLAASAIRMMQALARGEELSTAAVSKSMAALAEQAVQGGALSKGKIVVALLLGGALASGVGVVAYREAPMRQPEPERAARLNEKTREAEQPKAPVEKPKIRTDRYGDPLPPQAIARLGSLRLYHGQHVDRVSISPDGKWVVSAAVDGNRLWDAATGRELPFREELRRATIFATRDKLVAVARQNLGFQLWDIASGKKIGALLPAAKVEQLSVAIHLSWLEGYSPIALSPDDRTLVIVNRSGLHFCDVIRGQVTERKLDNVSRSRMAFSADGKTLVVQCNGATVHVWDLARRTEQIVSRSSANDYGGPIVVSPDGTILATAPLAGKRVRLWDLRTLKECPPLLKQPDELIRAIAFSPDGKQLVSIKANSPILHLWDLATRKEVRRFRGKTWGILHTVFSADGKYLVAGDGGGVTFWDVATGKFRHNFGHTYTIDSLCFSPNGKTLASGASYTDKIIRIWDPLTGKETAQLRGHKAGIQVVAYAPDGKRIASASQDGTVRLWDAATGREIRRLESKDGQVYGMAFAPDGKILVSGGAGRAVHFWEVATGRKLRSVGTPGGFLMNLSLSPDGKLLATQDRDEKDIRLWDVATGKQIRRLEGQETHWHNQAFSPNGRTLAVGSDDGVVRLWDLLSGEERRAFAVPLKHDRRSPASSVSFSPDGHSLSVGYMDQTVRLWELSSGRERLRFEGHRSGIASLAFSPDSTLLASGGNEDYIIMV